MRQRATRSWGGRSAALGLVGTLVLVGCDTAPPGDPAAPTSGQVFVVDEAMYAATVAPILTSKGCDNAACHGGGLRGSFELSPFDDKDLDFDFIQVVRQLNPQEPVASTLLTKPLAQAAGGDVHTAPSEQFGFMSVDDPDYQAILAWIEAGELQ